MGVWGAVPGMWSTSAAMQIRFPLDAGKRAIPSEQFSYRHCVTVPAIATRSRSSAVRRRLFLRFPRRTSFAGDGLTIRPILPFGETTRRHRRRTPDHGIGVRIRLAANLHVRCLDEQSNGFAQPMRELPRSSVHSISAFSAIALV